MFKIFKTSLSAKLIAVNIITLLIVIIYSSVYFPLQHKESLLNEVGKYVTTVSNSLTSSVGFALKEGNFDLLQFAFNNAKSDSSINYIAILDENDALLVEHNTTGDSIKIETVIQPLTNQDFIRTVNEAVYDNKKFGKIILQYSLEKQNNKIKSSQLIAGSISLAILIICVIFIFLFVKKIVKPITQAVEAANKISDGELNVNLDINNQDETGMLINSMKKMVNSINLLVTDANSLSKAASEGNLNQRAEINRHGGEFRSIIEGFNDTLDSVINPLNLAAEYVDRISKGDIPPKIEEEYSGDFNEIKNNLNSLVDTQNNLISELDTLITSVSQGKLDKRGKSDLFIGGWGEIIKGLNDLIDAFVRPINVTAEYIDRISKGDIPPKISDNYRGDFNEIKNNLNQCIDAISLLVSDASMLAEAGKIGKLRARANATSHNGDFRKIINGVNKTLDSVVLIIDNLPIPALILDNQFNMIYANETAARLGGKSGIELEGTKCHQYFSTPDCNTENCACRISMAKNKVTTRETIAKVGSQTLEIQYTGIPIVDESGEVLGAFEVIVDQTQIKTIQRETQQKARESEEKAYWYEQLLDAIPSPISVTDLNMNWTFINKAAETVAGAKRDDVIGKHCSNWGADICNTEKCGVHGLRNGRPTSYFTQPGLDMDFKVDSAYITNKNGEKIGHIEVVNDITETAKKSRYLTNEIDRLAANLQKISKGNLDIDLAVAEPDKYTKDEHDNFIKINQNLKLVQTSINKLISDADKLATAANEGRLDTRADTSNHNGVYRNVIEGVNKTLDNVIGPLNVAAEYIDRIAKGDIPPKITDNYRGDFNELKNNLNRLIDNLDEFIESVNDVYSQHSIGEIDAWVDSSSFQGSYKTMAESVNNLGQYHVKAILEMLNTVKAYGEGDFTPVLRRFPGKQAIAHEIIDSVRDNLMAIAEEIGLLINSASEGKLTARANASIFSGGWGELVSGVNSILDSVIIPLNEAAETLEQMASGNLTATMTGRYQGDLEQFKNSINSLGESLSYAIGQVIGNVQSTAESAMQISSTAESLAAASQEQSAQADEVATAVEQMSRTVTENAMAAGKTAIEAEKNGRVARDGGKVVEQTVAKMRDIALVVKNSAENIMKLGESSKQIGEIISVIDDIADQTNLLALNAAIEAARAGEQGRGFAVVADEVRKLAERTTEATKQIAKMIKGIQEETQQAVTAMNRGNEEVKSGIELADRAGTSLQEIVVSSTDVQDMVNQIAAASEEQSSTSEEISKNMLSISKVTGESARRIEDIAHSAEDLSKLTDHLSELMGQFNVGNNAGGFSASKKEQKQISVSSGKKHLPARSY